MRSWLISIVGIVFLGILFDMIYPNGKTNKICKSVLGIATLLVMISPIFEFKFNFDNKNFINNSIMESLTNSRINLIQKEIEVSLSMKGIEGVFVSLDSNFDNNELIIENIYIDISNAVLLENYENINKYEVILNEVQKVIDIDKENVIISG